ncbi:hypothetical protein AB0H43_02080 [Hamadaea sp. NPDC050747]|uniref:hypothetical protein n=1 Tax=Hamadaea sp. NPDC050747 TaxID=3155789 RepID=UPI0033C37BED
MSSGRLIISKHSSPQASAGRRTVIGMSSRRLIISKHSSPQASAGRRTVIA